MIKSTIASIAMVSIAGTLSATATAEDWDMRAFAGGEASEDLEAANNWTLAAISEQGPGLVFVCTVGNGMRAVLAYDPDEDLVDQAVFSRGFTSQKTGNLTVGDQTIEDRWSHRRRASTLTTDDLSTIVTMLNGVNHNEEIVLDFNQMEPMSLTFPETSDAFSTFVQSCPTTGRG
ncbi:hypothetical protein [Ponticaulis sp.]|uniref:hypothetical protein n=1 Tax=Ponticaulis sp. TaxID=2020902 RepID=UPI000C5B159F|nr:hypothetical protein [Ponticaulis sp.]MAJ08384.1 hypothetical protein [Ponticaulis sp.]HBH90564.1 hypothetical protein [Hyphomonadaceae bacterium]HBJ92312.1 hypothetical protein [Hyphomonadaceae bacterium]|tara:strand:- start:5911 stop:6435 length:525 start_codon:yes stop_codon:yes gene_type:complete